jgi:amino acid adenylation domain-containing protein
MENPLPHAGEPVSSGLGVSDAPDGSPGNRRSAEAIEAWLVERLSRRLYRTPDTIDVQGSFFDFGLSSREAVLLTGEMEQWLRRRISPMVIYEHPTIESLAQHLSQLEETPEGSTDAEVSGVALDGSSHEDMRQRGKLVDRDSPASVTAGNGASGRTLPLVMLFAHHGPPWLGVGQELLPEVRCFWEVLKQCDELLGSHVDWSLLDTIAFDQEGAYLDDPPVARPVVFALQVALATLWRSQGVMPHAVIGQGTGVLAAAHLAGRLTLDEALRIAVGLEPLGDWPADAIFSAPLRGFADTAGGAGLQDQLRDPISLAVAVGQWIGDGCTTFLEIGPETTLAPQVATCLTALGRQGTILPTLQAGQEEWASVLETLDTLNAIREELPDASPEYPLSYGQQALWFLDQLAPGSSAYNLVYTTRLAADTNMVWLQRGLRRIVERHAVLRTTYELHDGRPVQRVHAESSVELDVIDASAWSRDELDRRLNEEADRPFDLRRGPVIRAKLFHRPDADHVLSLCTHHIAMDAWSFALVLQELRTFYLAQQQGTPPELPPLDWQYSDYVRFQTQMLAGPEGTRLASYWREQLADCQATLDLPTDHRRPPVQSYRGALWRFTLGDELSERLRALARAERATPHMMLLAAFQVLLYRYTGQEDFLVGSPTVGRDHAELERIVGYFVNPVVIRARMSGSQTFRHHLEEVRARVLGALAHQAYPFPLLVEQLQVHRDPSRSPLFQVAFDWYMPTRAIEEELSLIGSLTSQESAGGEATPVIAQRGAAFDLMLMMGVSGNSFSGTLQYNTDLFEPATIAQMAGHFRQLLEGIVADPEQRLDDLPLLSDDEKQQVLVTWNATHQTYPATVRVDELVAAQAQRTPDAAAVECDGLKLCYRELDARANQLARRLQAMGVGPGRLVGLCVDRSVDMVVAMLGTWKAGGAYVPLDPSYPKQRLSFMIEDSRLTVLVTQTHLADMLPVGHTPLLLIDADASGIAEQWDQPPTCEATAEDLAYVIYTSGSTGKPKGVEVLHRGVVNFLCSMARRPGLTAEDSLLAVTTLSFDISVLELVLPLVVGARVIVASRRVAADGVQLRAALEQSDATFMQATPATWRMLLEAGWAGSPKLAALCGGEALPCDLANALLQRVRSLWNVYGPTETAIWSTLEQVEPGRMPVPIGRPIANTQVYVLDHNRRPVPIGVAGELYIGGDGVARGYRNRPELTAERFVADPFGGRLDARLYRTGDLVRYLADGTLDFLGRLDHQVKVSGYRIELGEIEAVLGSHRAVGQAVVVAQDSPRAQGAKRLVAYYVAREEPTPTVTELREFLKRSLPEYMVPSAFVCLDALPLTPNGKIDRRRLPAVDTARPELAAAYVAPRTEKEKRLAELCAKVLGLEKVGVHDNFFELGAASIQSVEISARAMEAGLPLTPEMLFQHQTIAELTAAIEAKAEPVLLRACGSPARVTAATATSPAEASTPAALCGNTLIESLGVYLPPRTVSTDEVVRGCHRPLAFPLEQMTGIRSRRVAGSGEYAIDLARKAIEECLAHSKYQADDVELLICSSISRMDGAGSFTFEPSTAVRLRTHFGMRHALAFDVSNACVGMFTAIHVADAFLKLGLARVALVASGEYITHLTDVAQKEIDGFMDPRLACLTVGDAGAAVTLEMAPNDQVGFQALDLYTLGRHSSLCIAQATDQTHGGAIMHSDPIRQTAVALKQSVAHAAHVLGRYGWSPRDPEHLIMHQTSQTALKDAMREINATFQDSVCHAGNTIFNLAERGNTATTSHAVALWDSIQSGRIRSGDRILFGVSGSGQNTGTALYTLDTLPDRLRSGMGNGKPRPTTREARPVPPRDLPRVRVESLGICPPGATGNNDMIAMAHVAAGRCLETSAHDRSDIDLLVYAGVYRNHFLSEPAVASLVAGDLAINDTIESQTDKKTFAFDLINGGLGLLNACHVAMRLLQAGRHRTAMVIAAEVENNAEVMPQALRGIRETASAMILDVAAAGQAGFGRFVFKHAPEHLDALTASSGHEAGNHVLRFAQDARLHDYYLELIPVAVDELLESEGLELARIRAILPPQISSEFIARLGERLGVDSLRMVDAVGQGPDLFTSSLPYALDRLRERQLVAPGDIGLIIHVGSGIQVGCATYYF